MKTTLNLEVKSLEVPYYVKAEIPKVPGQDATTFSVPIEQLDALTLDAMCRDFRERLFKHAGKQEPPSMQDPDVGRLELLNSHMQQLDARLWGEIFGAAAIKTHHLREAIDLL